MRRRFLALCAVLLLLQPLPGQTLQKKPLSHDVYDGWKKISGESVSNDGAWVMYSLEPQEGDAQLIIHNRSTGGFDTIPRGMNAKFSQHSDFAAFSIKPFFADVRKAKIAKKKTDELPKDSLGIVRLSEPGVTKIARVKSFKLPEKGSGWIAYQLEKEPTPKDSLKKDDKKKPDSSDAEVDEKEKKDETGTTLVARELEGGREHTFPTVSDFIFAKDGSKLLFAATGSDSTAKAGVFVFDTRSRAVDTLALGKGKYRQLAWDEAGTQAAYVADRDTSKAKQRYFSLYYWRPGEDSAALLADTLTPGMKKHWLISGDGRVYFSKDGAKLFFGTLPVPTPEDTTFNDEETAKLDVWNWKDPLLQPHQLKNADEEKKRSYLAVMHLKKKRFVQLGDTVVPSVMAGDEGNADVALGISDMPYRQLQSWDEADYNDAYLIDVTTGSRRKVLEKVKGNPVISPRAGFVFWYDTGERNWFALSTSDDKKVNLTSTIRVPLYNELNDVPADPAPHGAAGWTEGEKWFIVYDRYDIWLTDSQGKRPAVNLTSGAGRQSQTSFRYVRLDPEERLIKMEGELLLKAFDFKDKSAGFFTLHAEGKDAPLKLIMTDHEYTNPVKAHDDTTFILVRDNFVEYPNLYVAAPHFSEMKRISDSNPQQKEYTWGTVELVTWVAGDGKPLDGLLYKPEDFDPAKKYPMVVYFYERMSDSKNRYWVPAPSASTINPSLFVSRGYIVFIPDIRYQVGYPGKSAMDCIVPGVLKLVAAGYVDSAHIGIQGQSWGGYQVAYIVTRTKMFAAAGAGAAVSDMISAYGGIRWESGMSRMFQYEKKQSRIGGTLWEKPMLFIENSPIFRADCIETPLLMMNNDADGAVPWYQGIELFTALRRLRKPAWMLVYNGEAHNLAQRKNRKDLSIRMLQFFDHFLKAEPEPVWMKFGIPATDKGKTLGYELVR